MPHDLHDSLRTLPPKKRIQFVVHLYLVDVDYLHHIYYEKSHRVIPLSHTHTFVPSFNSSARWAWWRPGPTKARGEDEAIGVRASLEDEHAEAEEEELAWGGEASEPYANNEDGGGEGLGRVERRRHREGDNLEDTRTREWMTRSTVKKKEGGWPDL